MFNTNGYVYSMTNANDYNQVLLFARHRNGTLERVNAYDTGGRGSGEQMVDPLASQGSIIISSNKQFLFVVNTGDNTISSFAIQNNGELSLVDVVPSGGFSPNALAVYGTILYVANRGNATNQNASNITGFQVDSCGHLCRIPYATYALSRADAQPSSMVFSPKGDRLVISELSTNQLYVYSVNCDGSLIHGLVNASSGPGPFGSVYLENEVLLVAEAGDSALSSYVNVDGQQLMVVSGSVLNGQKATCWVSTNCNQTVAYTSNAGTDTISIYDIYKDGRLMLRNNVLSSPNGTAAPLDSGVSCDGKFLYVLNGNEGSISIFQIHEDGNITLLQVFERTGLPQLGAQGLAVL